MNPGLAWITGASGLIGSNIVRLASACAPGWQVRGFSRGELDITDFRAVERLWQQQRPTLVVHCAAVSRAVACQQQPKLAWLVNTEATAHLAALALDAQFLFLSTDMVFDGRTGNYDESATVNPISVYAETKAAAEAKVLANARHTVLRVALNAGVSPSGDRSFTEQMRAAWRQGQPLRLFADEYRCPMTAVVTSRAVWALALQGAMGLYHLGGSERLSRYEIGRVVAAICPELHPKIEPASLRDYSGPARPPDLSLNCIKAQAHLPFPLPGFSHWVAEHPEEL